MSISDKDPNEMTFMEHLGELRTRLLRSFVALFVCFTVSYVISDMLFYYAMLPLKEQLPKGVNMIGTGVAEAFVARLVVAAAAALVFASPYWFYQTWLFVSPGLRAKEKMLALPFVLFATLFFLGGIAFGYFVVFPVGFAFFLEQYKATALAPQIRISQYLSFCSKLLLAFGLSFEMPIVAFFLGRLGLITWRSMMKSAKYAIVAIFIAAAVFTPPDVFSQLLLAAPLLLLYGGSILLVALTGKK